MLYDRPIRNSVAWLVLGLAAASVAGVSAHAADSAGPGYPRITYTKVLKGSIPEYISITVDQRGVAIYEGRKLDDPPSSRRLQLREVTTRKIFELAGTLHFFADCDLESYKKVANLGRKTFVYDDGVRTHQAEFNYTLRHEAQELTDIFEKISTVAQHIAALEYAIQFDRLNLPEQLRQIQKDLDRRALAEAELMAPTLEKIVENPRILHLAQSRAQNILERLQNQN